MSPISRALQHRFEQVCRAELERLKKKTASLSAGDREQVDAISVQVTQAIAHRFQAALERPEGNDLAEIVARLFAVPASGTDLPSR
jgi:hypothetical protein